MIPNWLWNIAYGGCGLAGLGLTLLYAFQEKLIYVPKVPGFMQGYEYSPNQNHLNYKDVWFQTSDGKKLHGWLMWKHCRKIDSLKERPTIIFFQANAGNISHRLPLFHAMITNLDCSVIAVSYRGYGISEGSPTERGLMIDAETVLEMVGQLDFIDTSCIFVFGRSLGGAVAIDLVSKFEDKVRGLIVENTFSSIADMVPCMFPLLGPVMKLKPLASLLIRNKWNSDKAIRKITNTPILFLASGKDEMVPPGQMKKLYTLCRSPDIKFEFFPNASHMNAFDESPAAYWTAIKEFVNEYSKDRLSFDSVSKNR